MQSFAFYIIRSLALPPAAELLAFLWLYLQRMKRKKYQGNSKDRKREINPKPPRRRRLPCPLPLLTAAPGRRQTSSRSLLSPPTVVAAPPRPRAPLQIVNHNRRRRRIRMPRDSFRSPLTGAPRSVSKRWRAKKSWWMHLGTQEVMTRQILHNCWALHSVSANNSFFLAGYAVALWASFVGPISVAMQQMIDYLFARAGFFAQEVT